jgi:4-alpha-glucanotransferase
MEKENFHWWQIRLKCAEKLYHIYRIDHVIGLFRTWSTEGSFVPSNPDEWPRLGKTTLEHLLSFSTMFPIAEDLGVMSPSMRAVLQQMKICTTKVMRWELKTPLKNYNPFSMTTLATHDMEPTPLWWKNCPQEAEALAKLKGWIYQPELTHDQTFSLLQDAHSTSSYFHINPLQEYLYLFPELHAPTLDHDRINTPGIVSSENWSFKFHCPIRTITQHPGLKKAMKTLTEA